MRAGIRLGGAARILVPGPVLRMAKETARQAREKHARPKPRRLSGKSRPDCEYRIRQAACVHLRTGTIACDDGAAAARSRHTDAVSRPGMRRRNAVCFF